MTTHTRCLFALLVGALGVSGSSITLGRVLTFEDRIAAQAAIERVYQTHRHGAVIGRFQETVPVEALAAKVRKYSELSLALEHHWGRPVTAEMLQRETWRMLQQSKMPERLAELFRALDDDPVLVQECLVRAALVERLTARYFADDARLHADTRRTAERLRDELIRGAIDPHQPHPLRRTERFDLEAGDSDERSLRETGEVGPLQEERHAFVVEVVLGRDDSELRVARFAVAKQTRDAWLCEVAPRWGKPEIRSVVSDKATLSAPARAAEGASGCPAGTWDPLTSTPPRPRVLASTVWTGTEMIVWGGTPGYMASGDRYDPANDSWTATSTINAPEGRRSHTAVWTGQEMIVWGGRSLDGSEEETFLNDTGGRYDPVLDLWTPMSSTNAPAGRSSHTAVWAGDQMIVWGGSSVAGVEATGARYDPASDLWTPISSTNAPAGRSSHMAVWTSDEMIVWGGFSLAGVEAMGGRYDPLTDSWIPMSEIDAPLPRSSSTAVWTGQEMIIWGGSLAASGNPTTATGGRYDPVADTWSPTSTTDAPEARYAHSGVWTGDELLVWGGSPDRQSGVELATGGAYDPTTDAWEPTSTVMAPPGRHASTAVWTGSEMIVWGGIDYREALTSGGRYDPETDAWTPTDDETGAPTSATVTYGQEAVWTGSEMLVFTYNGEGARYDPATASWSSFAGIEPSPNSLVIANTLMWTGSEMIVWAGESASSGRYDPVTETWAPMSDVNAPSSNRVPAAVWTGAEMIVWSGTQESTGLGGRYDPLTDQWTPTSLVDAPIGRWDHTAVWTGSEMIVWGGFGGSSFPAGGRYDPELDRWLPVSTEGAPAERWRHTAVWSGSQMIVWGGAYPDDPAGEDVVGTGGRYDPASDSWTPTSTLGAPGRREWPTAAWTGDELIVWGGNPYVWPSGFGPGLNSGGHYDPSTDSWKATALDGAPAGRTWHEAHWTGDALLVWGGRISSFLYLSGGGVYKPAIDDDVDGVCVAEDCDDADPNNWMSCATCGDDDTDTWYAECDAYLTLAGPDCDDAEAAVYPGADEINDALDNQCPGDIGYGAVDEISGTSGFSSADRYGWSEQAGATLYEVARASRSQFSTDCLTITTVDAFYDDPAVPGSGSCWFYLVRALADNPGSWGLRSDGVERTVSCQTGPAR